MPVWWLPVSAPRTGILDEEKAADETLTALAEGGGINDDAASTAHGEDDADDDESTRARQGSTKEPAARTAAIKRR